MPGQQDRGVEQDEAVDLVGVPRCVLERETAAERVAEPGPRARPGERRGDAREVVVDPPGRLPRRVAVPEEIRGEHPVRLAEPLGQTVRSARPTT